MTISVILLKNKPIVDHQLSTSILSKMALLARKAPALLPAPTTSTMKHMIYDETHFAMQNSLSKMITEKINPNVAQWEKSGRYPAHYIFKMMGQLGVFAVNKPEEFGGTGRDFSMSIAVAEQIGSIDCGSIPMSVMVQTEMSTPALAQFGSDFLRNRFLRPSLNGDLVSSIAVSEPHAGSDVSAIRTHARRFGTDLIINGSKMWITNGDQADWACVLVNTSNEKNLHKNKSLVCIPLDSPGVHRSSPLDKLGMRCSDTVQLFFEDVRVPASFIIGEEGRGFSYQMKQFNDERLVTVAVGLLPLQNCINKTIEYARERSIFGKTLLDQQYVQFRLAELEAELEATRSLLYRTVMARCQDEDVSMLTAMSKLKIGRLARKVTDSCLQIWGGAGYLNDNGISRAFRDFRIFSIGAGCDEVMMQIIHKTQSKRQQKTI
ncbi:CRE-ACDH-6 protein [Caenorhabditis remanei]|uniref:CRE-ACDH-6 protein n=1 Tax=Caenorhabditis remanei TaxID=31234 RepID=E3MD29_CAERE|nr:CRE-ACDH-6 protein [Caenorhabditis remanei]